MSNFNKLKALGFAMSNQGLEDEIDEAIRAEHPSWNNKKVEKERKKIQKKMTLFNGKNKKPKKIKKPKKVKEPKKEKEVKATTKVKKEKNK